jgi:putative spermidine/putrescine transport system substrate-binding protein
MQKPPTLVSLTAKPYIQHLQEGFYDDTKVATWIVQEGICYNRDKFKEVGIPAPTTYSDLGNPKLEGLVTVPDITSGGGLANFAGMVYAAGGDAKNIGSGLQLVQDLNVLKFWKRAGEAVNMMQTGDVAAALLYTGWCSVIRKSGAPVDAVLPKIGADSHGVMKNGWIGIVKGTKVPELATFYINQFINKDFQSTWAPAMGVIPASQEAMPAFLSDPVAQEFWLPIEKNLYIDYHEADIPDWTDKWTRAVSK